MSRSQPNIWRKIQKIGDDISSASLAFLMYDCTYIAIVESFMCPYLAILFVCVFFSNLVMFAKVISSLDLP